VNRKLTSLICASLALSCVVCNAGSLQAQDYGAAGSANTSGSSTTSSNGSISTGTRGSTSPPFRIGSGSYSANTSNLSAFASNNMRNNTGYVCVPGYAMTAYASGGCSTCGMRGWYASNFGPGCGYGGCGGGGCGLLGGFGEGPFGCNCWGSVCCGSYVYGGYAQSFGHGGCGYRRGCCCAVAPVIAPACCSPVANCCGMSCGAVSTQPGTVIPTPGAPAAPLNTVAPDPAPSDPAPAAEAPKPSA